MKIFFIPLSMMLFAAIVIVSNAFYFSGTEKVILAMAGFIVIAISILNAFR